MAILTTFLESWENLCITISRTPVGSGISQILRARRTELKDSVYYFFTVPGAGPCHGHGKPGMVNQW